MELSEFRLPVDANDDDDDVFFPRATGNVLRLSSLSLSSVSESFTVIGPTWPSSASWNLIPAFVTKY